MVLHLHIGCTYILKASQLCMRINIPILSAESLFQTIILPTNSTDITNYLFEQ